MAAGPGVFMDKPNCTEKEKEAKISCSSGWVFAFPPHTDSAGHPSVGVPDLQAPEIESIKGQGN